MNKYKGRVFAQETKGVCADDGFWTVTVTMREQVTWENGEVQEEVINAMSMDKNFDDAHKTALRASLQELQDLVYARGFESLIEGREYQRSIEA
jgi:hypothetical protein